MTSRDEIPLGTFEEQVLLAVIRTAGRSVRHGGAARDRDRSRAAMSRLARFTRRSTGSRRSASSRRSERRKAACSRRLFSVTRAGAQALAESRAMRDELWRGVNLRPLLGS